MTPSRHVRVHLVTYATPRFAHRQLLLGASAKINRIAHTITAWNPQKLIESGFNLRCADVRLSERGSGFWAWKPFIIEAKLKEVPDGDLVLYCDVGRLYPFKLLYQPLAPIVVWMDQRGQDFMPGIEIPWEGKISRWTKREALVTLGLDRPQIHESAQLQASFSIWRAGSKSLAFVETWMNLCSQRSLVSDDPSAGGLEDLPEFRGHRHDQALLTLCCIQEGVTGLGIGLERPTYDTRNPSEVALWLSGEAPVKEPLLNVLLRVAAWFIGRIEKAVRKTIKFGEPLSE